MKTFLTEDFLLRNETARRLYHEYAKDQPIYDYHCHLPPQDIASNRRFENLYDLWLAGDHYKWRAMRSNGVDEKHCTGEAEPYEKFLALARTVPNTLRNPLYHWTHLELKRYFGIDDLLDESTAQSIWDRANEQLAHPDFTAQRLIERSKVTVLCTTDDPAAPLAHHKALHEQEGFHPKVHPTFRPDKAMGVDKPEDFNSWISQLEKVTELDCSNFGGFLHALAERHRFFHEMGARLSDHGLTRCPGVFASEKRARKIFEAARSGEAADPEAWEKFAGFLMVFFGQLDARQGWVKQLHLGAQRNNNSRLYKQLGPDTGFDSIGDWRQAENLARYLDALDSEGALPKTIIYNLNPADNYVIGTMIGNFQDGSSAGKIQFGSGWWFLDQKEGMQWQINTLSNLGLLSRFIGMTTDSRSFLSYSRHEYFRRILCQIIGEDVENGELPNDLGLLGGLVKDISYGNAASYFGLETGSVL